MDRYRASLGFLNVRGDGWIVSVNQVFVDNYGIVTMLLNSPPIPDHDLSLKWQITIEFDFIPF